MLMKTQIRGGGPTIQPDLVGLGNSQPITCVESRNQPNCRVRHGLNWVSFFKEEKNRKWEVMAKTYSETEKESVFLSLYQLIFCC